MKLFLIVMTQLLFCNSFAAEKYPSNPPMRLEGLDQQNVGSCMAEADTNAIEHYYSERGVRIKVSSFYRHAKRWNETNQNPPNQTLTAEDKKFLASGPAIVPHFMYPEDSQGLKREEVRQRPSLLSALVFDSSFPKSANAFKFKKTFYTFAKPKQGGEYSNAISLNEVKEKVRKSLPVVFSIHSLFLHEDFDPLTGLLNKAYSFKNLRSRVIADFKANGENVPFAESQQHSVAIVGFDDSLYADQKFPNGGGAFIIANSWVDPFDLRQVNSPVFSKQSKELKKMRLKVYQENLPAYFAIPYQYFYDLMASKDTDSNSRIGMGGITVLSFDYNQFAEVTTAIAPRYKIYNLPFICDRWELGDLRRSVQRYNLLISNDDPDGKRKYMQLIYRNLARDQVDSYGRLIHYAKLSENTSSGVSRLRDFLNGKLNSYYCLGSEDNFFPSQDDLSNPDLADWVEDTVVDPSVGMLHWLFQWISNYQGVTS